MVLTKENIKAHKGVIITSTGRYVSPLNMTLDMLDIEDIAHSLSNQCRWGGHCNSYYSVAEHSVLVSRIVNKENSLAGLLHDAAEAYLSDVPTPIKKALPQFTEAEDLILEKIAEKWNVEFNDNVKWADEVMLAIEARFLTKHVMNYPLEQWMYGYKPKCLSPKEAKELFLSQYYSCIENSL